MTRNDLIKRIHVLKRELSLDDDTYRMVLSNITGKLSCKDIMSIEELNLVCVSLSKMKDNRGSRQPVKRNPDQHRFIARLMDHLKWSWPETAMFCEKVTGKRSTTSCSAAELSKVIRGMIATIDHHIKSGKITMTTEQLAEYRSHTQRHRAIA